MRIVASPEVVAHVQERGGHVFVWTIGMVYGYGFEHVFTLEASTESPGADRSFVTFSEEGLDLHLDPGEHGTPESIHLSLAGRRRPQLRAYWNGNSFAEDRPGR